VVNDSNIRLKLHSHKHLLVTENSASLWQGNNSDLGAKFKYTPQITGHKHNNE